MPVDPPADPFAAAHADPGRPDPPPSAAPPAWPAPVDAAALNPLAGGGTSGFADGRLGEPGAIADDAPAPDRGDAGHDAVGEAAAWTPVDDDAWALSDGVEVLSPASAAVYDDWPDPAAAPSSPAAGVLPPIPFTAAPPAPPSDAPPAATSFADGPTAAAPSRPSVPWDPHQDPPQIITAGRAPGGRWATARGVNLLYAAGAAVVGFLLLTALFFNVLIRTTDEPERAVGAGLPADEAPAADAAPGDPGASIAPGGADGGGDPAASDAAAGAPAGDGAVPAAVDGDGAAARDAAGDGTPARVGAPAAGAEVEGAFVVPSGYRRYDDPQHGFSLRVPAVWREARRSAGPDDGPDGPDHDVVFEAAGGEQRLAVSVWSATERPPFDAWLPTVAAGLRPLDDGAAAGEGVPFNAFLAGEPAVVLGAPETAVSHLAYAAFLAHGPRYLRIAWADLTGLTRPDEVLGALASFGWVGDDIVTGSAGVPNQVPRLALPQGTYWPSEALFGVRQP